MTNELGNGLSELGTRLLQPAPVADLIARNATVTGKKINLSVGDIAMETIPLELIHELSQTSTREQLNYRTISGEQDLKDAIRNLYLRNGFEGLDAAVMDKREIIVGPSVSYLDAAVALTLANPGDYVIMSDPWYYVFSDTCKKLGLNILTIPEDDGGMRLADLNGTLESIQDADKRLAFVYLLPTSNPKGTIMSNSRIEAIVQIMTEFSHSVDNRTRILYDNSYNLITPANLLPQSAMLYDEEGLVIEVATVSKALGPGLRTGWAFVSKGDKQFVTAMKNAGGQLYLNQSAQDQNVVAKALMADDFESRLDDTVQFYSGKARSVQEAIEQNLVELHNVDYVGGQAGFYFYLTMPVETTLDSPFCKFLMKQTGNQEIDNTSRPAVLYVPGQFCVNPEGSLAKSGKRQLRISFGYEPAERAVQGVEIMADAVSYAKSNR
jgi:2-aminoadipate transaminase